MTDESTTYNVPPMPPMVAAAVSKVMGGVKKIAKGEKNQHGGYNFASIDDFLEAVGPLCAEAGLILVQDEDSFEIKEGSGKDGKPISWLHLRYKFTLSHSSGETWAYQPVRSIIVNGNMGSQAFGAAQSYVLKQFERSLFQIPTGDKEDIDHQPATDLPATPRQTRKAYGKPPGPMRDQFENPLQAAEAAASKGLAALETYWKEITPATQKTLEPHKANLKAVATEADLERSALP